MFGKWNRSQQEVDKATADQTESQKALYALLLNIERRSDGAVILYVHLEPSSAYHFKGGVKHGRVLLQGDEGGSRTIPDISNYWRYKVKLTMTTNLAHSKEVTSSCGEIVDFVELAGKDLPDKKGEADNKNSSFSSKVSSIFVKPVSEKEQFEVNHAKIIQGMVDHRNGLITSQKLNAPMSYPKPNTPEGEFYKYDLPFSPMKQIKQDVQEIRHSAGNAARPDREFKRQSKFYQRFPGGEVIDGEVNVKDRKGKLIVKQTKGKMVSMWTDAEFKKASWENIQARGRKFSPLLKSTPSTLLQPIKTWVKAIGDVETLAISSLMAIFSIISLGDFNPPSVEDNNQPPPEGENPNG